MTDSTFNDDDYLHRRGLGSGYRSSGNQLAPGDTFDARPYFGGTAPSGGESSGYPSIGRNTPTGTRLASLGGMLGPYGAIAGSALGNAASGNAGVIGGNTLGSTLGRLALGPIGGVVGGLVGDYAATGRTPSVGNVLSMGAGMAFPPLGILNSLGKLATGKNMMGEFFDAVTRPFMSGNAAPAQSSYTDGVYAPKYQMNSYDATPQEAAPASTYDGMYTSASPVAAASTYDGMYTSASPVAAAPASTYDSMYTSASPDSNFMGTAAYSGYTNTSDTTSSGEE